MHPKMVSHFALLRPNGKMDKAIKAAAQLTITPYTRT